MYAKNLSLYLHQTLCESTDYAESLKRFEHLRGYDLLPRSRKNAGVRLSNEQIASSILGFASILPGWAGLVSLCMGNLRPVGGVGASFQGASTFKLAIATLIEQETDLDCLIHVTLSIGRNPGNDSYLGRILFEKDGVSKTSSYVSSTAISLLQKGSDETYNHEQYHTPSARQLILGKEFFKGLRDTISLSRHFNRPLDTDWKEYESEEELKNFHDQLGAQNGSRFLNVGVDTHVNWPKEPTRVGFGSHHLVLFPKTKDNSHSISIDLANEKLSGSEAQTLINRFLSLLSWCDDQHAIFRGGWSGNPVPVPVPRHDLAFATSKDWLFNRSIPQDDDLLQRLAYYREGLNAREGGIISFEVLSFFKVFESRPRSTSTKKTKKWVAEVFDEACRSLGKEVMTQFHKDRQSIYVEQYILEECRVATAHASELHTSDVDESSEIRRLLIAAEVIHALARHYIRKEFKLSESYFSDNAIDGL